VNENVLNSYCWMYSTFNIPLNFRGICTRRAFDSTNLYNSYYQVMEKIGKFILI